MLLVEILVMLLRIAIFSGPYQESQLEKYQRVDRINQVGLNSLRTLVKDNSINCDWIESGIYHTAADKNSEIECDYFINYLKKTWH